MTDIAAMIEEAQGTTQARAEAAVADALREMRDMADTVEDAYRAGRAMTPVEMRRTLDALARWRHAVALARRELATRADLLATLLAVQGAALLARLPVADG